MGKEEGKTLEITMTQGARKAEPRYLNTAKTGKNGTAGSFLSVAKLGYPLSHCNHHRVTSIRDRTNTQE